MQSTSVSQLLLQSFILFLRCLESTILHEDSTIGIVSSSAVVRWKNKLGLVHESGTSVGKASVGCTQLTQGPPSSGLSQAPCTRPETNEGSSGHNHTCFVCWVLCLLHVWVARSFGLLLSTACWLCNYPLFTQLLTGVGQPSGSQGFAFVYSDRPQCGSHVFWASG